MLRTAFKRGSRSMIHSFRIGRSAARRSVSSVRGRAQRARVVVRAQLAGVREPARAGPGRRARVPTRNFWNFLFGGGSKEDGKTDSEAVAEAESEVAAAEEETSGTTGESASGALNEASTEANAALNIETNSLESASESAAEFAAEAKSDAPLGPAGETARDAPVEPAPDTPADSTPESETVDTVERTVAYEEKPNDLIAKISELFRKASNANARSATKRFRAARKSENLIWEAHEAGGTIDWQIFDTLLKFSAKPDSLAYIGKLNHYVIIADCLGIEVPEDVISQQLKNINHFSRVGASRLAIKMFDYAEKNEIELTYKQVRSIFHAIAFYRRGHISAQQREFKRMFWDVALESPDDAKRVLSKVAEMTPKQCTHTWIAKGILSAEYGNYDQADKAMRNYRAREIVKAMETDDFGMMFVDANNKGCDPDRALAMVNTYGSLRAWALREGSNMGLIKSMGLVLQTENGEKFLKTKLKVPNFASTCVYLLNSSQYILRALTLDNRQNYEIKTVGPRSVSIVIRNSSVEAWKNLLMAAADRLFRPSSDPSAPDEKFSAERVWANSVVNAVFEPLFDLLRAAGNLRGSSPFWIEAASRLREKLGEKEGNRLLINKLCVVGDVSAAEIVSDIIEHGQKSGKSFELDAAEMSGILRDRSDFSSGERFPVVWYKIMKVVSIQCSWQELLTVLGACAQDTSALGEATREVFDEICKVDITEGTTVNDRSATVLNSVIAYFSAEGDSARAVQGIQLLERLGVELTGDPVVTSIDE